MIVFPAVLRPEVSNTPNKVLLMVLANDLAGDAVRIDGGQCGAGVHLMVIDCCGEAGRGAAADENPRRIDVVHAAIANRHRFIRGVGILGPDSHATGSIDLVGGSHRLTAPDEPEP